MPSIMSIFKAATIFASCVSAHMIMISPVPYGNATLDSSPLLADGSNFPCKQRDQVYDAEGINNIMPIGVNQTLRFKGSAVHGGGSCQISLTTDQQPTKSSKWSVIYSIEGGCPALPANGGNLPEDPNGNGASTFQFSIPQGIANGQYTLAWTWFNKVGNREMYMNCAPVTVTGGSSNSSSKRDTVPGELGSFSERDLSLPSMFVANIGNGCTTNPNSNLLFPDPGSSVLILPNPAATTGFSGPVCSGTGSSSATSSAMGVAATAASPTPSYSSAAVSDLASAGSPTYTVLASSSAASEPSSLPVASSAPAAPVASGSSSAGSGLTGACSTEGMYNCIGGNSFQQCASGSWSVVQPMAAGMKCTVGQTQTLNMSAAAIKGRRAVRFSHGHARRARSYVF